MKTCKKCGVKLPNNYEKDVCEDCRKKRNRKLLIGAGIAIGSALTIGSIVFFKSNKSEIETIIKQLKCHSKPTIEYATERISEQLSSSNSKNYLTPIDKVKLDRAIDEGILPLYVYKRAKTSIEMGLQTADQVIAPWGPEFLKQFDRWENHLDKITDSEFVSAVTEAARKTSGIEDVKIYGKDVSFLVRKKKKKSTWPALFEYADDAGKLNSVAIASYQYADAKTPRFFAENIQKELKYIIETTE